MQLYPLKLVTVVGESVIMEDIAERGIKLVMETKDKPEENASLLQALHEVLVVGKQFYTKANGNP